MIKHGEITKNRFGRLDFIFLLLSILLVGILARLFYLQVFEKSYYLEKARAQHLMSGTMSAKRGDIFFDSSLDVAKYPIATNKTYLSLYAVPKMIQDASSTSMLLANILQMDKDVLFARLSKSNDIYEPIKNKLTDDEVEKVKQLKNDALKFTEESYRFYPEGEFGAQVVGFVKYEDSRQNGIYGLESFWNKRLQDKKASYYGEKDAYGNLITIADNSAADAQDGSDLYLTIDQAIQHFSCEELKKDVKEYNAKSGQVIVVNPKNGDILAMCDFPSYDPNDYSKVSNQDFYNNHGIFTSYEPGSVFKAFTMAMGLDLGLVEPETTYEDTGKLFIDGHTIQNSDYKANGVQTMTNVLEKSLNTGVSFVADKVGRERFLDYARKFGFGRKTEIELDSEVSGNLNNLNKKGKIYLATASFGQGITATPIQLVMAFSSFANGGNLYKPRIVKKIVNSDGTEEIIEPKIARKVISDNTAKKISAMLVSVIENGHGKTTARSEHYFLAGKTGTAQAIEYGTLGYVEGKTNQTFIGFGPARDPQFVILTKFEAPERAWAESTAAKLFGKISQFMLDYYKISPDR